MIGRPERIVLARDPDHDLTEGPAVQFRLTYEGRLLGASRTNPRPKHKHEIRKTFHKQLKQLFKVHPAFEIYRFRDINDPEYYHSDFIK